MKEQAEREGVNIPGHTLQTFERTYFHTHRENEIHGQQIPLIYHNFVEGSPDPEERLRQAEEMAQIVEHNKLDVASMGAVLGFLQQRGYKPWHPPKLPKGPFRLEQPSVASTQGKTEKKSRRTRIDIPF